MGFQFVVMFIDSCMNDVTFVSRCWSLYVDYDLLRTRVHLLWLWEFWIWISAWWICWTCWSETTVQFRISISVWLPLCRWV